MTDKTLIKRGQQLTGPMSCIQPEAQEWIRDAIATLSPVLPDDVTDLIFRMKDGEHFFPSDFRIVERLAGENERLVTKNLEWLASWNEQENRIDELKAQIEMMNWPNETLQTRIDELEKQIELRDKIEGGAAIAVMQARIDELEDESIVSELQFLCANHLKRIDTLTANLASCENTVERLRAELERIKGMG